MTRGSTLLLLAALGYLVAGCGGQGTAPRTMPRDEPDYRIEVRNRNFYAVNVYIYRDGFRDRLGEVPAATTRTFTFDWPLNEVRILTDFLGGGGCIRTESMSVVEGDDLLLIIQVNDHRKASRSLCGE